MHNTISEISRTSLLDAALAIWKIAKGPFYRYATSRQKDTLLLSGK